MTTPAALILLEQESWRGRLVSTRATVYGEGDLEPPAGFSSRFSRFVAPFIYDGYSPYVLAETNLSTTDGILESLKSTCLKGTDLVKQIEGHHSLLGHGTLRGHSQELFQGLDGFLWKDFSTIDALIPTNYHSNDAQLDITPGLSSHSASLICARFQAVKWSIRKSLMCELLSIEKDLRKQVLDVLIAALVTKRRPKYPVLINRATIIRTRATTYIEQVKDRLRKEQASAKAELVRIPLAEKAQSSSPILTPEWHAEFNAAFASYETDGNVEYVIKNK